MAHLLEVDTGNYSTTIRAEAKKAMMGLLATGETVYMLASLQATGPELFLFSPG